MNKELSIEKRIKKLEDNYENCCLGCRAEIDWLDDRIKKLEGKKK